MLKNNLKKGFCATLAIALFALSAAGCGGPREFETTPSNENTTTATADFGKRNPLTGLDDLDASAVGKRPVAVMVENHPQARPQWGLCSPDIVIEGLVEGGITRMMWLYADISKAPKIGPTRSARHDYAELAKGFDAIYAHFGGSSFAYATIKNEKIDALDGRTTNGYFDRDKSRGVATEHTAYTTGEMLVKGIAAKKFRTDALEAYKAPFQFTADKKVLTGGSCNAVKIEFSKNYTHVFKYDTEDELYYNYLNDKEMKDADGKTMAVTNVLVLYTDVSPMNDKEGHVDWDLSGGKGVYCSYGKYEKITWSKSGVSGRLIVKASDGKELQFNPGKMWIGFSPVNAEVAT